MKKIKDKLYKNSFALLAFSSLIFLAGITAVLITQALPVFRDVTLAEFITGRNWYPTYMPPDYGILPLILGTLIVSAGAMAIAIPLGVGSALYIHEIASAKMQAFLKPAVELLAGIPSIIYGFFGMILVAPFIQNLLDLPVGLTAFTASLILGFMALPTVASISEDALNVVPNSFREASYSLGASRWQTLMKIVLPAAGSGISTAIILGMGRVVGETMTVLMVAGGAAVIPKSFFVPVRPMTATIAAEMGEAVIGSTHYHALFAIGLILFIITFAINTLAEIISRRYRIKLGLGR